MTFNARIPGAFLASALLLASPPAIRSQDSANRLTAMDEFQLQTATDPQISPDGKKIVYVRRFADPMTDKRYSNLWVINSDGSDHRPLTTGNRSDASPRWSPDGTRIAYLSDADGKQQLYVRWMDTGQTARITNLDQAPDAIAWSPDGKNLIVSVNRHPESDHEYLDDEVYEFSVADGSLRALTNRKGPDNSPAVSPNGKFIAYTGYDDRYQGHQAIKLYLMNRDGTGSHSLYDKLDRDVQDPQWAPDSGGVYFRYDDQGDSKIGFCLL